MTARDSDPMVPVPYTVRRIGKENRDTFTLTLEPAATGSTLPPCAAGQFNMLYVFGAGEAPISTSGPPERHESLIHTVRAVGPVTRALGRLKPGDTLGVRGPYGTGWPVVEAERKDIILAAGGLGLAPLRSALYHILANREKYGSIALVYGTRTPKDLIFKSELEKWRGRFDLQVEVTVDSAGNGWRGNVGVVTLLISRMRFEPSHTIAMVCGPEVMMRFTAMELLKCGVEMESIFISMERNMKCGIGLCGHCQLGPFFVCKDGPVFSYAGLKEFLSMREL